MDVTIVKILFHSDNNNGVTHQFARSIYSKPESAHQTSGDLAEPNINQMVVKNSKHFNLLEKFSESGALLRLSSWLIEFTRLESGIAYFGDAVTSLCLAILALSVVRLCGTSVRC